MNAELINRAKKDPEAFGELYEEFYDGVYRFVFLRVREQALCEDLVSQVWEKILTHLRHFKGDAPEAFRAWVFTIARNAITEHFRRQKESPLPEDWDAPGTDNPLQDYKDKELSERLTVVLQGLPEQEREIVSLKVFAELSNKEIAKVVKKPERTVAVYLHRALKHVQKRLNTLT